jgi:N6-L-threonylcarbamoyladenine synthase
MIILGIETSCDETSVAIVRDGLEILAAPVFSQIPLHKKYFGVVPEIASRAHLEKINSLVDEAFSLSGLSFRDIDCYAVTNRPGLAGALMIGVSTAKAFSLAAGKPLIGVNHIMGHVYSVCFAGRIPAFPFIALVVSGGHTLLIKVRSWTDMEIKGTTLDDAVGEAFDKAAKILNLEYPGGPVIDKLAETGNPDAFRFPMAIMNDKKRDNANFSYSGLKTAVLYLKREKDPQNIEDVCASFRKAAIDILFKKTRRLCDLEGINRVVISGGVSANTYLRSVFQSDTALDVYLPEKTHSTDNAAMIAGYAYHLAMAGKFDNLNLDVYPKNDMRYAEGVLL